MQQDATPKGKYIYIYIFLGLGISRTLNNVQNCDSYINIPSSQTYR
jgi:hypothetical protein